MSDEGKQETTEETEGQMKRRLEEDDAEGQRRRIPGAAQDDAEGQGQRRHLEGDDTEGQGQRRHLEEDDTEGMRKRTPGLAEDDGLADS